MYLARIHVTLKEGVLDPQGSTVARALQNLGYSETGEVRIGKYLEVRLGAPDAAAARQRVEEMCRQLLVNPVIEEYTLEVETEE